jgi:hypothetical protein
MMMTMHVQLRCIDTKETLADIRLQINESAQVMWCRAQAVSQAVQCCGNKPEPCGASNQLLCLMWQQIQHNAPVQPRDKPKSP